jgi:hypothetical protein
MDQPTESIQLQQPIIITSNHYNDNTQDIEYVAIRKIIYNPDEQDDYTEINSEDDYTDIKSDLCETETQDSDSILSYESDYEDELEHLISER